MNSIATTRDDLNRARAMWGLARSYQEAADALSTCLTSDRRGKLRWPISFLYSHSAELGLKAFLLLHGYSAEKLGKYPYAHDLKRLCHECTQPPGNLTFSDSFIKLLEKVEVGHAEYQFRYVERSFNTASTEWMGREVASMLNAVYCALDDALHARNEAATAAGLKLIAVPTGIFIIHQD